MMKLKEKFNSSFYKFFLLIFSAIWLIILILSVINLYDYYAQYTGYMPIQQQSFSHKMHSGERIGIKCLYCHHSAEFSSNSSLPTTKTCMVCHIALMSQRELIKPIIQSYETGAPLEWRRVYRLPDYVKFIHSRHINAQIDCSSCHGNVEEADTLSRVRPLTMGWCLDCHRNPEKFIIPARAISGILITKPIDYKSMKIPDNCSVCHQ